LLPTPEYDCRKNYSDLKKQNYKPVYWLEGEEEFFIDQIIDFALQRIFLLKTKRLST
jgi:DNA polymerase III delta subunit